MKRALIAFSLAFVLLAGAWAVNAASANFAGTWVLDKSKSQGLSQQMENVETYTMVVTQDDKQLTVEHKFAGGPRAGGEQGEASGQSRPPREGASPNGGGNGRRGGSGQGGGRGGRGGFGMGMGTATYKLDGTETQIESAGGRGGSGTMKAQWKDGGKFLELTTTRSVNFNGNETTRTTKERWELADGGKILKVKRTTDGRQGSQESTLVFNRQ
jgi:hypothetical protein